jgi:hypothetical protein
MFSAPKTIRSRTTRKLKNEILFSKTFFTSEKALKILEKNFFCFTFCFCFLRKTIKKQIARIIKKSKTFELEYALKKPIPIMRYHKSNGETKARRKRRIKSAKKVLRIKKKNAKGIKNEDKKIIIRHNPTEGPD